MAKIVVVDDALFMRKMLTDILTNAGHSIVGEAETAYKGYELYKKNKPDIITFDIIMPEEHDMNSMKAIKEIIAFDKNAKVLMVSAMGQQELVVEALQAGAKDFIVKPFQPSSIKQAVERLLSK